MQAPQQLHCLFEVLVIPLVTPADRLEFVKASKFFNLQTVHSVFLACRLFDFPTQLIPKEFRCPHA
jgi:hypothetical protein